MKNKHTWTVLFVGLLFLLFSQCNILAPVSDPNAPGAEVPDRPIEPRPGDNDPVVVNPPKENTGNLSKEEVLRLNIVDYAKTFQGTNYLYAGRDPKIGFDCSGFTYFVMDEYGVSLSPSSRAQENQGRKISVNKVQPGDLIFYRRLAGSSVFHVSLVVDNQPDGIYVIHSTSRGVVIDNISTSSYWAPKISTARDVVSGKF